MMNESSQILPLWLRQQCNFGIQKLREKNEDLVRANTEMDVFIYDQTSESVALNNLKQQLEDYKLVSTAIMQANDSDIIDFDNLRGAAENVNTRAGFIQGWIVLANQSYAESNIAHCLERINYYTERENSWFSLLIGLSFHFRQMRIQYTNLLEINQEILQTYKDKEQLYNDTEQNTSQLFSRSYELRARATSGLGYIGSASVGMPLTYDSENNLGRWRVQIQAEREHVNEQIQQFIQDIIDNAVILDEDGNLLTYEWDYLKQFGYEILLMVIERTEGADGLEAILALAEQQRETVESWGVNVFSTHERYFLLEALQDHRIMERMRPIAEDSRFSAEAWENATLEERQALLDEFMELIVPIFGVDINMSIDFFVVEPFDENDEPVDPGRPRGNYRARENGGTVGINNWWVDPDRVPNEIRSIDDSDSHILFRTVIHEVRHAYQHAAINNPDDFMVSEPTRRAWESNYPPDGHYIGSGNPRRDGDGYYTRDDYLLQPIEADTGRIQEIWDDIHP